jgi:hypothetical protein
MSLAGFFNRLLEQLLSFRFNQQSVGIVGGLINLIRRDAECTDIDRPAVRQIERFH